jgi:TRAP-type C4-dicarboxylate transport system substrate-binding protein
MTDKKIQDEVASIERRNFLKLTGAGAFTVAMVAGAAGTLWSDVAVAQTAKEEREREAAAEHVMTIATAYILGASRSYPIMQLDLKENIQNATNGKVYVRLAPGGQLGAGGALCRRSRAAPFRQRSTRCPTSRLSRRLST